MTTETNDFNPNPILAAHAAAGAGLSSDLPKSKLSEYDVRQRFITPALNRVGWANERMLAEYYFTQGPVLTTQKGKVARRKGKGNKADYILFAQPDLPIAIVEAKDFNHPVSGGIQQAIRYAEILDLPFVFSANGDGFCEYDRATGVQSPDRPLAEFPSPDALLARYWASRALTPAARSVVDTPYYYGGSDPIVPRYYQRIAINRTVEAVARGTSRILLVMATGTGKTYTAFQIIHRLHASGLKKKILYLADRNVLIDQTMVQDFRPFLDKKVMTKIEHKDFDASFEIYMSLYTQWVDYDAAAQGDDAEIDVSRSPQPYESLSPDFFDLIVVDECHRGSVRENSEWRRILEYFSSATQIGMTATPKSVEGADNLDYFCRETDGEPLYVYSLKQGIADGFLAPYRVTKSFLSIDLEGWTPEPGERDLRGQLIEARAYNRADMGRDLLVNIRRQVVARRITRKLAEIGRMTKTIVFCPSQDEAQRMRDELVRLNPDACRKDSRYVMRITSDDVDGKRQLDNFIDPDEPYPTVVTTSELLETGVDCKTCGLIVFDKEVTSMTRFKQMIGRGTRINERRGKLFFDVLDFRDVTSKFADPDFDGVADASGGARGGGPAPDGFGDDEPGAPPVGDPPPPDGVGESHPKYYIEGPSGCRIVHERVEILDDHGRLVTVSVKDWTRRAVRSRFATLDDFLSNWSSAERKQAILDELEASDTPLMLDAVLQENPALADKDAFDVILHLAFDQKPLTRRERVENVRKRNYLARYEGKAREILDALLDKYADGGVRAIESDDVLDLAPFSSLGTPTRLVAYFGGAAKFDAALRELESQLYGKVA
jgi:type I restriction enzyme, R subunit